MKISLLHRLVIQVFSCLVRGIIKLRYKVKVEGLDTVLDLKNYPSSGVLFLPNHPAEIDPIILMSILGPHFFPRCAIVEHFYHLKGFKVILDLARVVPLPSMAEKANQWRGKELGRIFEKIGKEIDQGENYLIYPSGKLKKSGLEQIGGSSFVHNLLQERPKTPVILIRTTGLWGSCFSVAQTGKTPRFQTVLKECIKVLLKNGIFFVPKRTVLVEFEKVRFGSLPLKESRLVFNKYLEDWYNNYPSPGQEPISLVPYVFWNRDQKISVHKAQQEEDEEFHVSEEIEKKVKQELSRLSSIPISQINRESHLSFDLGLDSLDVAQLYLYLDKVYFIHEVQPGSLTKVKHILQAIAQGGRKAQKQVLSSSSSSSSFLKKWKEKKKRKNPQFPGGRVLAESFLRSCDRMGGSIACADRNSDSFSYKELKRGALVLREKIKDLPGERVGVLLPSSVGAYLSILAVLLSGKIPVMLNWTSGKISLGHALKTTNFQSVLTSRKFLDNIQLEDLSEIEDRFVLLEEIKTSLRLKDKLKGFLFSFFSAANLMEKLNISRDPEDVAVFLFTSGTESLPKVVPLSHYHILTNQKGAFSCVTIDRKDVFYGVLPPFHSFGFSLTGLLPLIFGIKIFYSPDPTDSRTMALDIQESEVTIFCSAPSFLRPLIAEAQPEQLKSLQFLVVGAERMPIDLEEKIKRLLPDVVLAEGYGITECSPVVTLQRLDEEKKGVGKPLNEIEIAIVDPTSFKRLPLGVEGEVWISGPSVFEGYLGNQSDPFFYMENKKWYRSGDLGKLDESQNLYLTDRLKRIVKIGAEMVSLGGVESELLKMAKEKNWYSLSQEGSPLAVIARETGNEKAEIVLFTTFPVTKDLVNQHLRETGFGRIVKISEVIQVTEIPLTGTGKTHHRLLEEKFNFKSKKETCLTTPTA